MKITKIELAGRTKAGHTLPDAFATIERKLASDYITVTILTNSAPARVHQVQADSRDDQWSMAECLQETLDAHTGTNSMVHEYMSLIERFAD